MLTKATLSDEGVAFSKLTHLTRFYPTYPTLSTSGLIQHTSCCIQVNLAEPATAEAYGVRISMYIPTLICHAHGFTSNISNDSHFLIKVTSN